MVHSFIVVPFPPPFIRINMGGFRHAAMQRKNGIKVHRSVKIRMEAQGVPGLKVKEKYKPGVEFRVEPTWVD